MDKDFHAKRCLEFARSNVFLRGELKKANYSRYNYMGVAVLGWAMFVMSQLGWLS